MQAKHFCRVDGLVFPNILQYNLHHQIAGKRKTHSIYASTIFACIQNKDCTMQGDHRTIGEKQMSHMYLESL
jgi:hypothetical protein